MLILIKGLGLGGAERVAMGCAQSGDSSSFRYLVAYVLPWKDQLVPDLEDVGVEVHCIGGPRGFDVKTPKRLREVVRHEGVDLIHAHLPTAGVLARLFGGVPVVYTEHNVTSSYRLPTRLLNRWTYSRNHAVAAVSNAVGESVGGYPGPPAQVIPNGVSIKGDSADNHVRSELGLDADQPLVVHVGNIRPHKGHTNLIRAAAELANLAPDARIVSIGAEKRPGDLERVKRESARFGVSDRITFLGRREDALAFLAAADVVVNPSDFEGLPIVILEALALAKPVVATDVGGVSSIVQHERTGLLVGPDDPSGLAKEIARALTDDLARDWGKNGALLVAHEHSVSSMARRYEKIYEEVLNAG